MCEDPEDRHLDNYIKNPPEKPDDSEPDGGLIPNARPEYAASHNTVSPRGDAWVDETPGVIHEESKPMTWEEWFDNNRHRG